MPYLRGTPAVLLVAVTVAAGCMDDEPAAREVPATEPRTTTSHTASKHEGVRAPGPQALGSLAALPPGLERFRGRPVTAAAELTREAIPPRACGEKPGSVMKFVGAWLAPDALSAGYVVKHFAHDSRY